MTSGNMASGSGSSPGGLQLFPPPPKKAKNPSRIPSTRGNGSEPQRPPQAAVEYRPESRNFSLPNPSRPLPHAQASSSSQPPNTISPIAQPSQAHIAAEIPRSHTSLSEAPTLVRSNSLQSHSSIGKNGVASPSRGEEPVMRSIFPRYNPELPLEYQPYFPTQQSPTHIPKTVINRRPYSPSIHEQRSPMYTGGMQSPLSIGSAAGRFPQHLQDEPVMEPSNLEELKELWKVANGWRVSASEGRTFCLKMTTAAEEPVHTLSASSGTPFYTLKVIPTSTSAQVSMTRQDPNRGSHSTSSPRIGSSLRYKEKDKDTDVLSSTLEEPARRLPPNDGLVALLYPRAASNMALDMVSKPHRADSAAIIAAAEREAGRLVWDVDSEKYYLVHPALQTPFVVCISSSPAWSRVEYTLEHPELPRNLVRLVRDGAGTGFLEVDSSSAARIDAFYIVDVAICAIMLVSTEEEKKHHIEHFEAPPSIAPRSPHSSITPGSPGRRSMLGRKKKDKKREMPKMEAFELDLEEQSQNSLKGFKAPTKQKEEKTPGCCGLLWMLVKCLAWSVALIFKGIGKTVVWICGRRKKNSNSSSSYS